MALHSFGVTTVLQLLAGAPCPPMGGFLGIGDHGIGAAGLDLGEGDAVFLGRGIAQDDFEPGSCHASEVTEMVRPKPYKAQRVAISVWADGGRIESTRSHGIEANSGLATSSPLTSDAGRRGSLEVLAEVSRFSRKSDMGRRGFINSAGVGRRGEQGVQLLAQTA